MKVAAVSGGRLAELLRFGAVAIAGLLLDLSIAWTLAVPVGIDLKLAAAAGFGAGACLNYVLHEVWTFRDGAQSLSAARALRYLGALALTLATRIATVAVLERLFPGDGRALLVLLGATALSFFVNYAASRFFVFRRHAPETATGEKETA
jgi:putative flippase GtrA